MCSCLQNSMDCWLRLLLSSAFCFIPRSNRNAYHLAFLGRTIRSSIFVYVGFSCLSFLVCLWYCMQGEGFVFRDLIYHCSHDFPRQKKTRLALYTTVLPSPISRLFHVHYCPCAIRSCEPLPIIFDTTKIHSYEYISRSSMHGFCCFRGRLDAYYRIKNIEVKFDSPRLLRPNCTDPL